MLAPGEPLPHAPAAPQGVELAVAEVLEHGHREHQQHVAFARVDAERQGFQQQAVDRQQDAHADGDQQEHHQRRRGNQTESEAADHHHIAGQFDQRPHQFEQGHERPGQQAGGARTRAQRQRGVAGQAFGQTALPAAALAAQRAEVLGRFGPADRIGQVADAIGNAPLAVPAVQAHHQFHVLAHGAGAVAADRQHALAVEQAEGTGNDQHRIERRPAQPAQQERAQVFDDLEPRHPVGRQPGAHQKPATHLRPVGQAHRAAGGHGALVLQKRLHHPQQAVALQDGIGIDRAEQRVPGGVDSGIECVGLAAVLLVDHPQVGVAPGAVHAADGRVVQGAARGLGVHHQVELLAQHLEGAVAGAVVDHHQFEIRVLQLQHRTHRGADGGFLVVAGHQQRDRRLDAQIRRLVAQCAALAHVAAQTDHRQQVQRQIAAVERDEVADEEDLQPPEPVDVHGCRSSIARRSASCP